MTTRKRNTKLMPAEALLAGDRDSLKQAVKDALQEVLEGEMTEFLGAAPGERTDGRSGYRLCQCGGRLRGQCRMQLWPAAARQARDALAD
jgi:transposase-like protein